MSEYIQSVRREVMRRVYMVFFLRTVVKPFALKAASAGALAVVGAALISVRSVWFNMPSIAEAASVAKFLLSAFLNTELAVQALALGLVVLAALALRDLLRAARFLSRTLPARV